MTEPIAAEGVNLACGTGVAALARGAVRAIEPYAWEESSEALAERYGLPRSEIIRFDTNTSPFPPAGLDEALERVRREPYINEYFDTAYTALAGQLATYASAGADIPLTPGHLIIGAGADEVLDIVAKTFLDNGDHVVTLTPTYSMYRIGAEIMGATVRRVAYEAAPEFTLPLEELLAAAAGARLLYLCAPNNPTGALPSPETLTEVIRRVPCAVVVDEAYFEFCGHTVAGLIARYPHLIVVRTLSKAFSLAGARLGYGLADPETIGLLSRVRPPNSVAYTTVLLAEEGLRRAAEMRQRVSTLLDEKERLTAALRGLGLAPLPSQANFFLLPWPDERRAAEVHEALRRQGLVLRRFEGSPSLGNYLRVTVRSTEQNDRLIAALATV